jgi:thiol:disulfide interchange protein
MKRREFMILAAVATLAAPMAHAAGTAYSPEGVAAELAAGRTVLLDFTASWCSSCQAQGRKITALLEENPAYSAEVALFLVDWDTYKGSDLAQKYGITSRGSLVFLRGDAVIAQTATHSTEDQLRALLDQAVSGA